MIVFVSNYLSPHQIEFVRCLEKILHDDFYFIATKEIPEWRKQLGYPDFNKSLKSIIRSYENEESEKKAVDLCMNCEALIIGSAPEKYYLTRLKKRRLSFKYGERFFKTPFSAKNIARRIASMMIHTIPFQGRNYYLLAANAYMANDCRLFHCFSNRIYKFGYFPATRVYEDEKKLITEKQKNSLIWVGRFIDWKHPDFVIRLANDLRKLKYSFTITMVGEGAMFESIKNSIVNSGLGSNVLLIGAIPMDQVRESMERHSVFLFTSDRQEGWGAVLNEAMNSGCAVVASETAGSTPFLIKNTYNGLIYEKDSYSSFLEKVKCLLDNDSLRQELGRRAYYTIIKEWNANVAAERICKVINSKINNIITEEYQDGVCSRAKPI